MTDVSRVRFEGVDWRLPDGVGVADTVGVADGDGVGVVLLEFAGTGRGFLTVWGLDDPAPSSAVDLRLTPCAAFGLLWMALFSNVIACFSLVNLLATFVFDTLVSMKMVSGLMTSGSTQVSLACVASKGSVIWCMNMCACCTAAFSRTTSTWSPRA